MTAEELSWIGYEVHTREATWVCIKSTSKRTPGTSPDRIDYFMVFEARNPRVDGIPPSRKLLLRTSSFRVSHEEEFVDFLRLVVEGQMLDATSWDQFKEVYEKD
jgi:hypothetical protein